MTSKTVKWLKLAPPPAMARQNTRTVSLTRESSLTSAAAAASQALAARAPQGLQPRGSALPGEDRSRRHRHDRPEHFEPMPDRVGGQGTARLLLDPPRRRPNCRRLHMPNRVCTCDHLQGGAAVIVRAASPKTNSAVVPSLSLRVPCPEVGDDRNALPIPDRPSLQRTTSSVTGEPGARL